MLLSGKVSHRSNSSNFFWNLKDPVLCLFKNRPICYRYNCHHLKFVRTPVSYLIRMIIDAERNSQCPLAIDLSKILPDLFKLRTKAEKPHIQFSQHT